MLKKSMFLNACFSLLLAGCGATNTQYGLTPGPDVFWRSELHPRWYDAQEQAADVSQAFAETMGMDYELDFYVYVKDYEDDDIYGLYWGYHSPGKIDIYLNNPRDGFYETGLCHELLHAYVHVHLGVGYQEWREGEKESHFVAVSPEDAVQIIDECKERSKEILVDRRFGAKQ